MPYMPLILEEVPEFSREDAIQLLDVLYALTTAIENQYFAQIHDGNERNPPQQYDLFNANPDTVDFDDSLPEY
jgi:hypothetical protein